MLVALFKVALYGAAIIASFMLAVTLAHTLGYVAVAVFSSFIFAIRTKVEDANSSYTFGKRFKAGFRLYAEQHQMPDLLAIFIGPMF